MSYEDRAETYIDKLEAKLEAAERQIKFHKQRVSNLNKYCLEIQQERDEAQQQAKEWKEKYKQSCVKRSDEIEKVLKLQEQLSQQDATIAELKGALEGIIPFAEDWSGDGSAIIKAQQALSAAPDRKEK